MTGTFESALRNSVVALEAVPLGDQVASLSDEALLEMAGVAAIGTARAERNAAVIAGEIARRSAIELGSAGLAQRTGHRTPVELVRATTGVSVQQARRAVRVGELLDDVRRSSHETRPWLIAVGAAVIDGRITPSAAEAITCGLGVPTEHVSVTSLAAVAEGLVAEAPGIDVDRLAARARERRDDIDRAGIADRERRLRAARALRIQSLPDGMGRIIWTLDPESFVVARQVYDRVVSPRSGGPRFVDPESAVVVSHLIDDARTNEQIASDVFLDLVRSGAEVAPDRLLGLGVPAVQVLVSERVLRERSGHGRFEGSPARVSVQTVERIACSAGTVPVLFDDDGESLNLGRTQRLFSRRQRIALAVRDGGCRWPGCDRPPSWTEAHHVEHWDRDQGRTDLGNGLLLCRHHHLLTHNEQWQITRRGAEFWLTPPDGVVVAGHGDARPMPTKSHAVRDHLAAG